MVWTCRSPGFRSFFEAVGSSLSALHSDPPPHIHGNCGVHTGKKSDFDPPWVQRT
jgi:hypothetical protein